MPDPRVPASSEPRPVPATPEPERPNTGWTPTSDGPTVIYAHPEDYVWGDLVNEGHRQNWTRLVPAAAFDAVVAERDEAVKKLGIAIDVTHEFEDEKIALADRLAKWERGEWPSTEAQHGVLLDQIKELAAERDAASEVLALIYVMLTGAEPMWAEMPFDERCARAANEAQQAFLAVSGSSEPQKEA